MKTEFKPDIKNYISFNESLTRGKDKTKKVNFMIKIHLLENLEKLVLPGKRSEFVNEALQERLADFGRKKVYEWMMNMRNKIKVKEGSKSIVEMLREDRKNGHTSDRIYLNKKRKVWKKS